MEIQHIPDTPFNRRLALGHFQRTGHKLDGVYVSSDGILWHTIHRCCGETIPDTVPTWEDHTPQPDTTD